MRRLRRFVALAASAALVLAAPALWAGADEVVQSPGPLTNVGISSTLNCSVNHTGDTAGEWFADTACGTLVAAGGVLYGPASIPAGGGATGSAGYTPYTPVSQAQSGTGTADDPFLVVTVVDLGESGLHLTERDAYVIGQESYRTTVTVANGARVDVPAIIYRGGDCYLQDSDVGRGSVQNGNAPVCAALSDSTDPNRIEAMYPLTTGSRYLEDGFGTVWSTIGSQQPLPDTCRCDEEIDNGLALSWSKTVPAGGVTSVSALTVFSPVGASPLTFDKSADSGSAPAGASDGYTITVTNSAPLTQTLTSITDTLPAGFTYQPGSSSGATTEDPTVAGQTITWTGDFDVPGADVTIGRISLHFGVTVASTPGTYTNSVTGAGDGVSVLPATDVAPVTVTAVTQPVAADDFYSTVKNTPLTVDPPGLLANDTDVVAVDTDSPTAPSHGTATVQRDGSFVYTPVENFTGTDSFTYEAFSDGGTDSNPATVTITVTGDEAPTAVDDSYKTSEDQLLRVVPDSGVLANDTDPEGDTLTAALDTGPQHGALRLLPSGAFAYRPAADYNGTDSFTYTASDGQLTSQPATVQIEIDPVADPIRANPDSYTTPRDTELDVSAPGVLGNDVDVDGDELSASLVTGVTHGTLSLNPDGSFAYVPAEGFVGDDTFTYQASGNDNASDPTTVTITVSRVNRAPVANDDTYDGTEDTPLTVDAPGILSNDSDPDGDSLIAVQVSDPAHGRLSFSSDTGLASGGFTYVPDPDFNGTDSFTYQVSDGTLASNIATVTLDIAPMDDVPVAQSDSYSTPVGTRLRVAAPGVLDNDTDVDGNTLTAVLGQTTSNGTLALGADGSVDYRPNAGFVGADTFTYSAQANGLSSPPVTVTIIVTPLNVAPVARADAYTTPEGVRLRVALPGVLGNDSDADGNALSAVRVSGTSHGTLRLRADGSFVYRPGGGFSGIDAFRYRSFDGTLSSAIVPVTITVTPSIVVPPPPPPTSGSPSSPVAPPPSTPSGSNPSGPGGGTSPVGPASLPVPTPAPGGSGTVPPPPAPPTAPPTSPPTSPDNGPDNGPSTSVTPGSNALQLSLPSVLPGGNLQVSGTGCPAGEPVLLAVGGRPAGRTTADAKGGFSASVATPQLPLGSYQVTATCGSMQLAAQVSLVNVTGSTTTPVAQALTVAAILGFFLLLLALLVRRPGANRRP